jgi:hypothetical protein
VRKLSRLENARRRIGYGDGGGDYLDDVVHDRRPKTVGEINLEQQYTSTAPHPFNMLGHLFYFIFFFYEPPAASNLHTHSYAAQRYGVPQRFFVHPRPAHRLISYWTQKMHILRNNIWPDKIYKNSIAFVWEAVSVVAELSKSVWFAVFICHYIQFCTVRYCNNIVARGF